jgi:hypothetical protein
MRNDPSMDELTKLQDWYEGECNGDWEHQYGVRIGTLDNPGWSLDVDLWDTSLAKEAFSPVSIDRSDTDWVHCKVEGAVFKARGGAKNLGEMLRLFLTWAQRD